MKKKDPAKVLKEFRKRRDHKESRPTNLHHLVPSTIQPRKETDKDAFLSNLLSTWKKFPSLRFGQLLAGAAGDRFYFMEDDKLQEAILAYDPSRPGKCKALSPSRQVACSLEENHTSLHVNYERGNSWKQ